MLLWRHMSAGYCLGFEMKRIAIIGFGNNVSKNILPAVERAKGIAVEAVYVREPQKYIAKATEHNVMVKEIESEIDREVTWVYISTPISTHYEIAKKYLKCGMNVICEKPLTDQLEKTVELIDLASSLGLIIHEVCMYRHHVQYEHLTNTILDNHHSLKCLTAKFSIPHLRKDDIRYKADMGGGALLDVGYYPISLIVSMFGRPIDIKYKVYSDNGYYVDLVGIAILEYSGFYCVAEWGIGMPYMNQADIVISDKKISYPRIFSKPDTLETKVDITKGFEVSENIIGSDDHFVNMFENFVSVDYESDISTIIETSRVLSMIQG